MNMQRFVECSEVQVSDDDMVGRKAMAAATSPNGETPVCGFQPQHMENLPIEMTTRSVAGTQLSFALRSTGTDLMNQLLRLCRVSDFGWAGNNLSPHFQVLD